MTAAGADPSTLTIVGSDGSGVAQLNNGIDLIWEFEGWALTQARMDGMAFNSTNASTITRQSSSPTMK